MVDSPPNDSEKWAKTGERVILSILFSSLKQMMVTCFTESSQELGEGCEV